MGDLTSMDSAADYVVIGGGSSGGVIARRLTEDPAVTVCLLEAGGPGNSALVSTPGAFAALIQDFKFNHFNWRYNTEPNKALSNRPLYNPRGKMLGGSSGINGMVYIRGDRSDYDHWAELGNEGWSFDEVLPFFRKAENNQRGAGEYHGGQGPLHVSDGVNDFEVYGAFLGSAADLGHDANGDFNGAAQDGLGIYQFTTKDGKRASVKACYLDPVLDRGNLRIQTHARVHRIVFSDKRAVAVEYEHDGVLKRVEVRKEVIVSAGAFNSPQVLMLSGVGPKEELARHGIAVVLDLPGVGQNLHDHPDLMMVYQSRKRQGISISPLGLIKSIGSLFNYVTRKQGWLALPPTAAGGFLKTDPRLNRSDFQVHVVPLAYRDHARDYRTMAKWGFSILVNIGRPKSRGSVTLHDANPASDPKIDLNLLDHPDDALALREAFKVTQRIVLSGRMNELIARPLHPDRFLHENDEIDAYIRAEANHAYHPVGSCKMGSDPLAVVDARLKVRGLENVRVADASIMPAIVNGNTNAPCIMIGEKAAAMIQEDSP